MSAKRAGVQNRENIPDGDGGTGTLGPAVSVNEIHSSVDNHFTFALYVTGSEKTWHICKTRIWRDARISQVQFLSY